MVDNARSAGAMAVFFTMFVAGCVGDGGEGTQGNGGPTVDPLGDLGGVQGTVIDEEGRPLSKADVNIRGNGVDLLTETSEDGSYAFDSLEPNEYTVLAHKFGFSTARTNVTVKAGEFTTADIQLATLSFVLPHPTLYQESGYVSCSTRFYPGAPLTGVPGVVGLAPGWYTGLAACNVTELVLGQPPPTFEKDRFLIEWNLNETDVHALLLEMTWSSTQEFGRYLTVALEDSAHINDGTLTYGNDTGDSPLTVHANMSHIDNVSKSNGERSCIERKCELTTRVFAAANYTKQDWPTDRPDVPVFGPPPERLVDVGLVYQQRYDQWLTSFVLMDRPDNYTALPPD